MKLNDLTKIGFREESTNNGIAFLDIVDETDNNVFLQISTRDTDVYPILIVNQYDWNDMRSNEVCLPMPSVKTIEDLIIKIEQLKLMFI
jgi:hypothetical protein